MRDSNELKKKRETKENNERQQQDVDARHGEFSKLAAAGRKRLDEKVCVTALQDFELQRQRSLQRRSEILAGV